MEENGVKKEVEKQSKDARKISSLENLIPWLVHRLNTHLSSVLGYAQLLLPKKLDPESKKELEKVIDEAQRASDVIKDLVDFTRRRRPQKKVINLNELIESLLETKIQELNLRNIRLLKELSPSIPFTHVDPEQICQALANLINYSEGTITEFHGFGQIRVKTCETEGQVKIIISDDGPGIPPENISKIFDPFLTMIKGRGTGLELAISHDTVIEHGGTVKVESEWGKGTTFIITLPIVEGQVKKKKEEGKQTEVNLSGLKGLVVDDDPSILEVVSEYLERVGCKISTAENVRSALNIVEEEDFDFVICDMKMPVMSGSDFYEIIKVKKPSLKDRIIFSTGDLLGETTRVFIDSVMNPYIEKPFDLNELKEIIIQLLITKTQ
ncbi:MAG: response regulator [Deltaproteobacteria bacterium]|nr:response regulator [Deltaproteobacteria bacterium]